MARAKRLKMGKDSPSPTPDEGKERIAALRATVETYLPDLVKGIVAAQEKDSAMVLHQDAFAAGYHDDEYTMLGMAAKYAGLFGVTITVIGKNHETFRVGQPKLWCGGTSGEPAPPRAVEVCSASGVI